MKTVRLDEIVRQHSAELKQVVKIWRREKLGMLYKASTVAFMSTRTVESVLRQSRLSIVGVRGG
jgi:hypothetical protein